MADHTPDGVTEPQRSPRGEHPASPRKEAEDAWRLACHRTNNAEMMTRQVLADGRAELAVRMFDRYAELVNEERLATAELISATVEDAVAMAAGR